MPRTRVRMSGGTQTGPKRKRSRASATKATESMAAHSATPSAARRRLSGAQRRASSTATVLLRIKNGDELAFADGLAFADLDLLDDSRLGRENGDFHFHRFEDHDLAVDLDPVARLGLDLPDVARDLRFHVDDSHALFIPRLWSQGGFFGHRARQRTGRVADPAAEPACGLVQLGNKAVEQRRSAIANASRHG